MFSHMISQFTVDLPFGCAARLICHSFCLIALNHTICFIPLQSRDFTVFAVIFLMLISNWNKQFHKNVKCSVCLLFITHHRPTKILYIKKRESLHNFLYDLLYTILGPAFGTLVFLDKATLRLYCDHFI